MSEEKQTIVAVLSDLMFTVKIQAAAKQAGLHTVFVSSQEDALRQANLHPALMIFDLNQAGAQPVSTIAKLKGNDETKKVELLGFVSHVQADLIRAAREAGCDAVLARSAFSEQLPELLRRYAGR